MATAIAKNNFFIVEILFKMLDIRNCSHHSETNIGIALRAVPYHIGFLTAAIVTVGIPTAPL